MKNATTTKIEGLTMLTTQDVLDLISTALEGGSNYWYEIRPLTSNSIREATKDMEGEPFSDRLVTAVTRGVDVKVFDWETAELLGVLNAQSFAKAEQLFIANHRRLFGEFLSEDWDASTADVFFQLAVMGEVIYG